MRAVIYARYSSDNQRDASIEDQLEVCRRYVAGQGWTEVFVYEDRSQSGASRFRAGYQRLLADAQAGIFDLIICEALDRLGRKLADIADLFDRLSFLGIELHTVSTGRITPMHVGMLGTMAQMYLADLREKTWRGQLGRALKGKIPGGRAFGYDVIAPSAGAGDSDRGHRRINEAEAAVVRRIFEDFAGGTSPRAIAKRLNAEGVPGPDGRPWRDTTIRGQFDRGTGLLNNALYVGRLEWNRCAYVKNPDTGKRVARINPPELWEIVEIPALRIVSDDLWQRAKARQTEVRIEIGRDAAGNALNRVHRRQYLLSGLLVCGACGAGYTIIGKDRYGCAARKARGTCANSRTLKRQAIEARVLAGLKDRLMAPDLVAEFVAEFQAEVNRAARAAERRAAATRRDLAAVERRIAGILTAIEDGNYNPTLTARLTELEARKTTLEADLAAAAGPPPVVRLHPNLPAVYRDNVARLEQALDTDGTRAEAAEIIRGLIDRIVLTPTDDGLAAELHGDLAEILALCDGAKDKRGHKHELPGTGGPGSQLSVVAGARNRLYLLFVARGLPRPS